MIPTCLNHRQMTYDFCRSCPHGRDLDCPEYLADIEHTRQMEEDNSRNKNSLISGGQAPRTYSAEKPFYLGHVDLMRETVLPKVNARMFMSRFRRSQR